MIGLDDLDEFLLAIHKNAASFVDVISYPLCIVPIDRPVPSGCAGIRGDYGNLDGVACGRNNCTRIEIRHIRHLAGIIGRIGLRLPPVDWISLDSFDFLVCTRCRGGHIRIIKSQEQNSQNTHENQNTFKVFFHDPSSACCRTRDYIEISISVSLTLPSNFSLPIFFGSQGRMAISFSPQHLRAR